MAPTYVEPVTNRAQRRALAACVRRIARRCP